MNLRHYFEYRTARVIAAFRVALALVFLLAMLFEPASQGQDKGAALVLLASYVMISVLFAWVAWRSWWFDQRLAMTALTTDIAVFIVAVYLTEALNVEFTSPFMAFFALIMLSATMRWDWRFAAQVGGVTSIAFVAAGFGVWVSGLTIDPAVVARRTAYMMLLFLVLIAFSIQRREARLEPFAPRLDGLDPDDLPLAPALAYALGSIPARHGALLWLPEEEPRFEVLSMVAGGQVQRRQVGPDSDPLAQARPSTKPKLFDRQRRRQLTRKPSGRASCTRLVTDLALARWEQVDAGLYIPISAAGGEGQIILWGINGPSFEHVSLGGIVSREIAAAFDRQAVSELERSRFRSLTREALARDLHDSIAQSLAGACFQLEALRRQLTGSRGDSTDPVGADPVWEDADRKIVTVRDGLRREQGDVRRLITRLRDPASPMAALRGDARPDLFEAAAQAGQQWGVAVQLDCAPLPAMSLRLASEVEQILREAVANAARHGGARTVTAAISIGGDLLRLVITDDGSGLPPGSGEVLPWSIGERVAALDGQAAIEALASGLRLVLALPMET